MNCPKCGNSIETDKKFCPKCGYSLEEIKEKQIEINSDEKPQNKSSKLPDSIKYIIGGVVAVLIVLVIILAPFVNSLIKGMMAQQKFDKYKNDKEALYSTINEVLKQNSSTNGKDVFKKIKTSLDIEKEVSSENKLILKDSGLELTYSINNRPCTSMNYKGKFGAIDCITIKVQPNQQDLEYKEMNIKETKFIYKDGIK